MPMLQRKMKFGVTPYHTKYIVLFAIVSLLVFSIYFQYYRSNSNDDWNRDNLIEKVKQLENIPQDVIHEMDNIKVSDRIVNVVVEDSNVHTHVKECWPDSPTKQTVVFLHGVSFTSDTWNSLKTLHLAASLGYKAVALDLPGWGKSTGYSDSQKDLKIFRKNFLQAFFEKLNISRPIIISPSMSGLYSIRYMMDPEPNSCSERVQAFVAVAPTKTEGYTHSQYNKCNIPMLIVFGSLDNHLALFSTNNLRNMPNSDIFIMSGSGHACYRDNPQDFNKIIYYFLKALKEPVHKAD